MTAPIHEHHQPPGVLSGDYVPLDLGEFQEAFATLLNVEAGLLPCAPDFPTEIFDAISQRPQPFPDTPLNRGWYTAGKLFDDHAKRVSFYWRANRVMPLTKDPKYKKYFSAGGSAMHVALMTAVAMVPGSHRTTTKALRNSLDVMFRRILTEIDPESQVH
jgi:hypothetical protein